MPLHIGPVVLAAEDAEYTPGANITAIVWEGETDVGDVVILSHRETNEELWVGRTDSVQTYLGISFEGGLQAPNGFVASRLDSGTLRVYLKQL